MRVLMWLSIGLDRRTPSEHLLKAIIDSLYENGHTVHILQKNTGGCSTAFEKIVNDHDIDVTNIQMRKPRKSNFVSRYLSDLIYVYKCKKILKHKSYDKIFLQSSNVAGYQIHYLRKYVKNASILFNVQDIFPENARYIGQFRENSLIYSFFKHFQHKAYRLSSAIVTISEDMKEEILKSGIEESKVHVIYNWGYNDKVYDPTFEKSDIVDKLISSESFNVVYAGNIGLMQNVEIVLKAASILSDKENIVFHIFGDGLYKKKLEKEATQKGLKNVIFHDMLDKIYAPSIYCKADVNVIPLAQNIYRTALPSKTAICLAAQKPVVLAIGKESIFAQKLNEHTGAPLIDSSDYNALATIILGLYNKEIQYDSKDYYSRSFKISENSKQYVKILCG